MKKTLFLAIISIVLFSCSKDGYDANTDYNYPFSISLQSATNEVAGKDIPVLINISENGEYNNPEKEYTLKFNSSSQGYIKNPTGQIFDSSHEIKVTKPDNGAVTFSYVASTSGQHTVTFMLTNKQGTKSENKVTYQIADASFQLSANQTSFEVEQGAPINLAFNITENTSFTTPYKASILNIDDASTVKLNNVAVGKTTEVTLTNKANNMVQLTYLKAGNFTPTISVKNGDITMSLPISIKVKSKNVEITSFDLVSNTDATPTFNQSIKAHGRLLQTTESNTNKTYINPRIQHNLSTAKASIKFSASNNSINYILSEGQKYYAGDWFTVNVNKIENIQIHSKFSNYGRESITVELKDEYSNTAEPRKLDFLYYNTPKWTNIQPLYNFWQGEVRTIKGPYDTKNYILERIKNLSAIKWDGCGAKIKEIKYEFEFGTNNGFAVSKKGALSYDATEVLFTESWNNININHARWYNHRNQGIMWIKFEVKNEFGEITYANELIQNHENILKFL